MTRRESAVTLHHFSSPGCHSKQPRLILQGLVWGETCGNSYELHGPKCDPNREDSQMGHESDDLLIYYCLLGILPLCPNVCAESLSHVRLCDPVADNPPGSSGHGIFQARIPEWGAVSYSRGFSRPRNWTHVSCISYISWQIIYHCATWEALCSSNSNLIKDKSMCGYFINTNLMKEILLRVSISRASWNTGKSSK